MSSIPTIPMDVRESFSRTELSGRYELLEEIGRGGMGVVYRGRHRLLGHQVAIKFHILGEGIHRFQREAKLLAAIRSPNVVSVQDFEILPSGQAMLIMSWIAGSDLGRLLKEKSELLTEEHVVAWMLQVCEGMKAASDQGIVHRDLKPSNILVDEEKKAYVVDFGLALSNEMDVLTVPGGIMGTPLYMAPEQAEDPRAVDCRADIYSFGATFYHVLTHRPPFVDDSWFKILLKHKSEPLASPKSHNPKISPNVNDCLERCLAKSPRDRFQSFDDIASHLLPDSNAETPWSHTDDTAIRAKLVYFKSRKRLYLHGRKTDLPDPDVYFFPNQKTCVIGFGDLVKQDVDAVVSSDDESLSMGGGLSAELAWHAGEEYVVNARSYAPVRPGRTIVTTAGALPSRFVMHAVTMGQWESQWISPSRDLINEIMESCFYHADSLGLQSIAFPLLGTGEGQFSREICIDTMFRFLAHKLTRGLTTVQEARIVIYSR